MKYDYLKTEYHEIPKSKDNTAFTFAQISKLRDMAEKDVYPDGRFGDDACNV